MIDIRAVPRVLITNSVCIMHLIIALKVEEFYFLLTHCTKNHENKFANSIIFFPNTCKGPFTIVNIYVFVQSVLILRPPLPLPKLVLLNVDYFRECSFSVSKGACHVNIPQSMYIEDHHRSTMSRVNGSN